MTVIESQYFPPIEYFTLLKIHRTINIDGHEYFVKQTYRNRCHILSANGILTLSVPVLGAGKKIISSSMEIDYKQKWLNNHWRAIISAYNKSPFFEYFADDIKKILFHQHKLIFELNRQILTFCLKVLKLDTSICYTTQYIEKENEGIYDLRSAIHPKKEYIERNIYRPKPYSQVFGSKFVPNLSILDLLFCEGPNAGHYL